MQRLITLQIRKDLTNFQIVIFPSSEHLEPPPSPKCHVLPTSWWDNWLAGKSPRLTIGEFLSL